MTILFDLKDISVQYDNVPALQIFSYQLSGSITTIIGENGSGEIHIVIVWPARPHSGAVCFEGQPV